MNVDMLLNNRYIKWILWTTFILYLLILSKIIIIKHYPFTIVLEGINNFNLERRIFYSNFVPFKGIFNYYNIKITLVNVLGNIIIFIPLGFLLPLVIEKSIKIRSIIIIGIIISLLLEVTQFITGLGYFDINDIFLNNIGTVIGGIVYRKIISIYFNH